MEFQYLLKNYLPTIWISLVLIDCCRGVEELFIRFEAVIFYRIILNIYRFISIYDLTDQRLEVTFIGFLVAAG